MALILVILITSFFGMTLKSFALLRLGIDVNSDRSNGYGTAFMAFPVAHVHIGTITSCTQTEKWHLFLKHI